MFNLLLAGNEEVKSAVFSALASWAVRSADTIQQDLISFFVSGFKEKEPLRRGFLRCLHAIFKNSDAVLRVTDHLLG